MSTNRTAALLKLFDETTALFHRLRAVAAEVHGQGELSAGRRGILRLLDRLGPRTVPQLAREQAVSRQHIQMLVNGLLEDGLVATEPNPAHRRSPLLRLTPEGRRQLRVMLKRESDLLSNTRFGLNAPELAQAAATLGTLRRYLKSAEWRKHVAEHNGKN